MLINAAPHNSFHHGQVLEVVMCLEQGIAREELDQDTSYAPNVAGI